MSLESLRALRLQGNRPNAPVTVMVGMKPRLDDNEGTVVIPAHAAPSIMDFRPLMGLWVVLVVADGCADLALKTLDAMVAAGAKVFGASLPGQPFPCFADNTPDHFRLIQETRDLKCL
jgi:hypothetical protein